MLETLRQLPSETPGARLQKFHACWNKAPRATQKILRKGFHWTWASDPPPLQLPTFRTHNSAALSVEVKSLLQKQAIYQVPIQPVYLSNIFLVLKSTGGMRLIIDLSKLNKFIEAPYFHMSNHQILAKLLRPPAWVGTIDLQDAYFHIPIRHCLRKYLAFTYDQKLYLFRALPFGLNVAPYIFTRIMKWPLSQLHLRGINAIAYLDDWVIWDTSQASTRISIQTSVRLLQSLGLLVNFQKSQLQPSTSVTWLGVTWFTEEGKWSIPQPKQNRIKVTIERIVASRTITRRRWEALIGMLTFTGQILRQLQPLLQPLLCPQLIASHHRRDVPTVLPKALLLSLKKWLDVDLSTRTLFHHSEETVHLWTDASQVGWGGHTLEREVAGS